METRKWFDAYGSVQHVRQVTGDPAAVPARTYAVAGGSRGSPSDLSDLVLMAAELSAWLDREATPQQRRLVDYVWSEGISETATSVVYEFPDGSRSDPLPFTAEPPKGYSSAVPRTSRVEVYRLSMFDAPEVDLMANVWGYQRRQWLEAELARIGMSFAKDKGL